MVSVLLALVLTVAVRALPIMKDRHNRNMVHQRVTALVEAPRRHPGIDQATSPDGLGHDRAEPAPLSVLGEEQAVATSHESDVSAG
jgi:hypothetical protein